MKKIPQFCIDHSVATVVFNLLLIVISLICATRLQIRELPQFQSAKASIITSYRGASPEIVETKITTVIENLLSGVEGVEYITSKSIAGRSTITVVFNPGYDINDGMNTLRDKISLARKLLPSDVDSPLLRKAGAAQAGFMLEITDSSQSIMDLYNYVNNNLKSEFENIAGVASVEIWGAEDYSLRVWLNSDLMSVLNITIPDLINTLRIKNAAYPGGKITSFNKDYVVNLNSQISSIAELKHLIVKEAHGAFIRLEDIAKIDTTIQDPSSKIRINDKSALIIGVTAQDVANPVKIDQELRKKVNFLQKVIPPNIALKIGFSEADYINASIDEVYRTILEAVLLVGAVILLFLGSVRAAIIPLVTIPLCLITSLMIMYLLGFSINNMTLLALVLAIGLVVDDAIVVLENVHRYIEKDLAPNIAARVGSQEIAVAVVIMTFTLAAVYAPIGFAKGVAGKIFREFAFTLAGVVLFSGVIALTLSPMMCAQLLSTKKTASKFSRILEVGSEVLTRWYRKSLCYIFRNSFQFLVVVLLFVIGGVLSFLSMHQELVPTEDEGYFFSYIMAPDDATFNYLDHKYEAVEKVLLNKKQFTETASVISVIPNIIVTVLDKWNTRLHDTQYYANLANQDLVKIPGVQAYALTPSPFAGGRSNLEFIVKYNGSYQELARIMESFKEKLAHDPRLRDVRINLDFNTMQVDVQLKRDEISFLGVDIRDIGETLQVLLGGMHVSDVKYGAKLYDIYLQADKSYRDTQEKIDNYYVRNNVNDMVPLSNVISINNTVAASSLVHYDKVRAATLIANLAQGVSLGEGVALINSMAQDYLPDNVQYVWSGKVKTYLDSAYTMLFLMLLSLIFIYLILCAQFESFLDPVIILFTVPFSAAGAALILYLSGGTNNLYTQIGFITLVGLITKHGILITEFANNKLSGGVSVIYAIIRGVIIRFRPIVMTTVAMLLGVLPLMFASGPGANARIQLGWVIFGGMLLGTIFSLYVIPLVYFYVKRGRHEFAHAEGIR